MRGFRCQKQQTYESDWAIASVKDFQLFVFAIPNEIDPLQKICSSPACRTGQSRPMTFGALVGEVLRSVICMRDFGDMVRMKIYTE